MTAASASPATTAATTESTTAEIMAAAATAASGLPASTPESSSPSPLPPSSLRIVNARITYQQAPIHVLERFAFKDMGAAHMAFLKAGFDECVIVQTCNRVEVFAAARDPDERMLLEKWAASAGLTGKEFADVQVSRGMDAVEHLLKLASGLDSLVVGEDQILGQVRRAFEFSRSSRYAGSSLALAFDRALKVGSRVRAATGINKGNVSIASVAISLAEEYFDDLTSRKIMLIGTGEAATLVAKILKKRGIDFMITSRTPSRAKWFTETVASGTPVPFDDALEMLHGADLVFVATTAPYLLVTYDRIEKAMKNRKDGKSSNSSSSGNNAGGMMIFDLSNPRTVDDRVATIHGVKLVNMDQIAELVGRNMRSRMEETSAAEKIIEGELKSVDTKIKRTKAEPVIVSVFKNVDAIRERELKKALAMLAKSKKKSGRSSAGQLGKEEARIVEQLSYAIVEGVLSAPMNNLRKEIEESPSSSSSGRESDEMVNMVSRLFRYDNESSGSSNGNGKKEQGGEKKKRSSRQGRQ